MAVLVADLIAPAGELQAEFFPNDDEIMFSDRITVYLLDATTRVATISITDLSAIDRATRAWVYFRGFSDVLNRLIISPTAADVKDAQAVTWSATQMKILEARIAAYLAEFEAEIPPSIGVDQSRLPPSMSVSTPVSWV